MAALALAAAPLASAQGGCPACDEYKLVLPGGGGKGDDGSSGTVPATPPTSGSVGGDLAVTEQGSEVDGAADDAAGGGNGDGKGGEGLSESINALAPQVPTAQTVARPESDGSSGAPSLLIGLGAIALAAGAYALFARRPAR